MYTCFLNVRRPFSKSFIKRKIIAKENLVDEKNSASDLYLVSLFNSKLSFEKHSGQLMRIPHYVEFVCGGRIIGSCDWALNQHVWRHVGEAMHARQFQNYGALLMRRLLCVLRGLSVVNSTQHSVSQSENPPLTSIRQRSHCCCWGRIGQGSLLIPSSTRLNPISTQFFNNTDMTCLVWVQ